jgi:hypothetical protein
VRLAVRLRRPTSAALRGHARALLRRRRLAHHRCDGRARTRRFLLLDHLRVDVLELGRLDLLRPEERDEGPEVPPPALHVLARVAFVGEDELDAPADVAERLLEDRDLLVARHVPTGELELLELLLHRPELLLRRDLVHRWAAKVVSTRICA